MCYPRNEALAVEQNYPKSLSSPKGAADSLDKQELFIIWSSAYCNYLQNFKHV